MFYLNDKISEKGFNLKIDRLVSVLLIIIEKKKVTAEELSQTFNVSIRTIQRDIDNLCNAGVPIYGEVGKNGGYHITENYRLDKNYISQKEIDTLVEILGVFKETLFKDSIRDLLNKFSALNENNTSDRKLIIDTKTWGNSKRQNAKLDNIYFATENNRTLVFSYYDLNNNKTERRVEPYTIIMKGYSWYLYAYCILRNDYRLFNIKRIYAIKIEDTFNVRNDFKPIDISEIEKPRTSTNIKIKFSASMLDRIPDFFDPINEIIDKDENTIINCTFPIDEWLYSVLLSFGNNIEILEPDFLREEIINRLKETIKNYNL